MRMLIATIVFATISICFAAEDDVVCQGATGTIQCPQGSVVKINEAIWGRDDRTTCFTGGEIRSCGTDVTITVAKGCDGRNECKILTDDLNTQDPCPDVEKYARVGYSCTPDTAIGTLRKCVKERRRDWEKRAHIIAISPQKCVSKCKELAPDFSNYYCINKNLNYCLCGTAAHPTATEPTSGGCTFTCGAGVECGGPDGQYSCFELQGPPAPAPSPAPAPFDSYYTYSGYLKENTA